MPATLTDPQADALFAEIAADPGSDDARLVLADWLDERGDERGEFIRCQIELANHPHGRKVIERDYDARDGVNAVWQVAFDLDSRSSELLERHGAAWAMESIGRALPSTDFVGHSIAWQKSEDGYSQQRANWHWRRGFIERVELQGETWWGTECDNGNHRPGYLCSHCHSSGRVNALGPAILAACPTIREVRAVDREAYYNGAGYLWFNESRERPRHEVPLNANLPTFIFDLIRKPTQKRWKPYPSRAAADAALGEAMIKFGLSGKTRKS